MGIFADYAPSYWGAGLPVIPLRQRNKMPDINSWSTFGSQMPSEAIQQHWLASYPNGNIGLPFGPASGLCAIDIDTEDEALIKALRDILPPTPWVRVGKKGMGLIYRWSGQRNFKLRGADGLMICEFLGLGNQMVMPPSIHPETNKPYVSDTNLWEVMDQIQELGDDIEDKLRALLGKAGFEVGAGGRSAPVDIVPAGERDIQMVRHAGYLSRVVLGIDKSTAFGLAEAISHMHTWVSDFTARVAGDSMDPNKGVAKLLEFLIKDLEKGRTMPEGWDAGLPDEWLAHPTIQLISEKNQSQRWTVTKAGEWLGGNMVEKSGDADWCLARIEELINKVAQDEQFTETQFRALIPTIIRNAGALELKKTDLVQAYKAAKRGSAGGEDMDDHEAIARTVLSRLESDGEVRYDHSKFWQWSGSCFRELKEDDVYMAIASGVKGSMIVRRHSDYASVINVLRRMCRKDLAQVEENGLNFANGYVGEDLVRMEHDPKYGATFTLPFNYVKDAGTRCNMWFEYLHSVWSEEEDFAQRVMLLQEMFAITMFKLAPRYQKAFLLYGKAGSGKSQVLEVLRGLMPPDAVANLGPQHWNEKFSMTDLIGVAVNICGELPESGVIAGNIFKEVVEGSVVRTEFKGVDGFSFKPGCAHWFSSNYLPMSRDSSRGFIRRWMILDFNKVVPEEKQIKDLAKIIIAAEREEIAAWALDGLGRVLRNNGFTQPISHKRRVDQMRRINNSVQAFLESSPIVGRKEDAEMKARILYDQYSFHMKDVGRGMPVSYERFVQMLDDLEVKVEERTDPTGTKEYWAVGLENRDRANA